MKTTKTFVYIPPIIQPAWTISQPGLLATAQFDSFPVMLAICWQSSFKPPLILLSHYVFFCGVGLTPPLGPFFRSPRFRFLRSLCSILLGPCKSQHCGHIGLFCIPRMIHEGDCGVIGGANDDCRGNRRTQRKLAPAPLCPTTNPT
jgi:hypothetical protein